MTKRATVWRHQQGGTLRGPREPSGDPPRQGPPGVWRGVVAVSSASGMLYQHLEDGAHLLLGLLLCCAVLRTCRCSVNLTVCDGKRLATGHWLKPRLMRTCSTGLGRVSGGLVLREGNLVVVISMTQSLVGAAVQSAIRPGRHGAYWIRCYAIHLHKQLLGRN